MIIEASTLPGSHAARPAPSDVRTRRPRAPLMLAVSAGYLVALLLVWVTMRQFGDRWWAATVLLMAPRWPLALPLLVLWPWMLLARRWGLMAFAAVATWVVLFPILGLRVALPMSESERASFRLLTCNVHRQHLDARALAAYIVQMRPDVVALQGWSEVNYQALFGAGGWEIRREGELLVASRFPIGTVTPLDLSAGSRVAAGGRGAASLFEIRTPRRTISLINLHLASPHAGLGVFSEDGGEKLADNVDRRREESEAVHGVCLRVRGPLLLAGDFNTTDDSPIFREFWGNDAGGEFADAFSERGSGLGYTYVIRRTQLRIDHILAGQSVRILRCWVGPDVGSPHRPLLADVSCR